MSYFIGRDIEKLTIVCVDKQIIFNPKEDSVIFTDDSLYLISDKREMQLKYYEIINVMS